MAPTPDPGSNPAFRSRQQRHHDHGGSGDDDSWDASFRRFVADQRGAGFVNDVERQGNEAPADDSQRRPLDPFTPGSVEIVMESPEHRRPGRYFDQAVQAEADQRNGTGDQSGDDGDERFEAVPGDGEVFEALALANEILASLVWYAVAIHSLSRSAMLGRCKLSLRSGPRVSENPAVGHLCAIAAYSADCCR